MPILAINKRVNYDYEIIEKYEAGLVLLGYEVKAIKTGHISLRGSFVSLNSQKIMNSQKNYKNIKVKTKLPELRLINAHIPLYKCASTIKNYDPYRSRQLLVKKSEIKHLIGKKQEQGLTLVPLKIYTKHSLIKLEFGVGKGKKKIDKREAIKKREVDRRIRTLTKNRQLRITN